MVRTDKSLEERWCHLIGNVPPDPATCSTSKMIAIDFPTFPKIETSEYTIQTKTPPINKLNNTNQNLSTTYVPSKNISPIDTINACERPIVKNVNKRPK